MTWALREGERGRRREWNRWEEREGRGGQHISGREGLCGPESVAGKNLNARLRTTTKYYEKWIMIIADISLFIV